jgi:hypothetical protein
VPPVEGKWKGQGGWAVAVSDDFAHLEPCQVIKTGVPEKCLKLRKPLKINGCKPFWEADVLPLNYARNFNDLDVWSAIPA